MDRKVVLRDGKGCFMRVLGKLGALAGLYSTRLKAWFFDAAITLTEPVVRFLQARIHGAYTQLDIAEHELFIRHERPEWLTTTPSSSDTKPAPSAARKTT